MSRDNEMKALLEQTRFRINARLQKLLLVWWLSVLSAL